MPPFEIKHRLTGGILFSLECGSLRLCVEAAVKSGANLRGANLSDAYLRGANLRGANLSGAYLRGANLSDAYLRGANLSDAYLRGANLSDANLSDANLRGANLRGANLSDAYLRDANLSGANLSDAYLRDANLRDDLKLSGERPLLAIGPLGSRSDYLNAFVTTRGLYVRAGCFFGALDEFKAAVIKTHGDNIHAREYAAAIAMIEAHAVAWPAADEKQAVE